jgi:hypothetical protein
LVGGGEVEGAGVEGTGWVGLVDEVHVYPCGLLGGSG